MSVCFSEGTYKQYGNPTSKTSSDVERHILEKAQTRVSLIITTLLESA